MLLNSGFRVDEIERRKHTTIVPNNLFGDDTPLLDPLCPRALRARRRYQDPYPCARSAVSRIALETAHFQRRREYEAEQGGKRCIDELELIYRQARQESLSIEEEARRQRYEQIRIEEERKQAEEERRRREEQVKEEERRRRNEEDEQKRKVEEEEERRKHEEEERRKAEEKRIAEIPAPVATDPFHDINRIYEDECRTFDETTQLHEPFINDPMEKNGRDRMRKEIRTRVGQISSLKRTIDTASRELVQMFQSLRNGPNKRLHQWAMWKCADCLAEACDNIKAKHDASDAWPVAHVCARLFAQEPEIYLLFRSVMTKTCQYIVPHYTPYISDATQYDAQRGKWESEDEEAFFRRMVGYMRLWLALLVLRREYSALWAWWARILNQRVRRETASLIVVALEVSGLFMHEKFGKQWRKIVDLLQNQFLPDATVIKEKNPAIIASIIPRVAKWVEDYNSGRIPPPPGKEITAVEESALRSDV